MRDTAGFEDHFSGRAGEYASRRPHYPGELFDWLASLAPARGLALDVGAGNGQAALGLAEHFERVRASEPSAAQRAAAPPHPRIDYVAERAESLGIAAASADLIAAAQAAHWFGLEGFYRECRRVLRPCGVVALWSYGLFTAGPDVDGVVEDFYRNVVGPYWPRQRRHVEEGYRRLPFPFEELAAPSLAIETSWSLEEALGYVGTWSAVKRCRNACGREPLELLEPGLARAWGPGRRPARWPLHVRAGRR